jgi:hypothetical protein
MLSDSARVRLVKLLRMFSSSFDGEIANAARKAHELIRQEKIDWDDVINGAARSSNSYHHAKNEPPPPPPDTEAELIDQCVAHASVLTTWEKEFLQSIKSSMLQWGRLTVKQRAAIDKIVIKVRLYGRWEDDK